MQYTYTHKLVLLLPSIIYYTSVPHNMFQHCEYYNNNKRLAFMNSYTHTYMHTHMHGCSPRKRSEGQSDEMGVRHRPDTRLLLCETSIETAIMDHFIKING